MRTLVKAFSMAKKAHKGQKDKGGKPYIFHPIRVMLMTKGIRAKAVAIVHDVLEDSDHFGIDDFSFLDEEQIDALNLLTHPQNQGYDEYIKRIKSNAIAVAVKKSDLKDNMNLSRIDMITQSDRVRQEKYKRALESLENQDEG